MEPDVRDEIVDYVQYWSERATMTSKRILGWVGLAASTFGSWQGRYKVPNVHNGRIPRDFWLEPWERERIVEFAQTHTVGYRQMTYMMMDANVVAVSPTTVYRTLLAAGLMQRWNNKPTLKGTGFVQPLAPHKHWHVDISYLNIRGTFYYLCSILDGYSRYIVHWEIRESMKEAEVEIIIQRAREKFPGVHPRIISDNGPQFIAKDFKSYIRFCGMTHVRTSPYYPQSNGKIERWHKTIKSEAIRPKIPLSLEEARRIVEEFVQHYNNDRLHSAIKYVTPRAMLEGRQKIILDERDLKLAKARERRKNNNQKQNQDQIGKTVFKTTANQLTKIG